MTEPVVAEPKDLIREYWVQEYWKKAKGNNPTQAFKDYCETYPWALECRIYED